VDVHMSPEQGQLAAAEAGWLERHDPVARLRGLPDDAAMTIDPGAFTHATESGLLALLTPDMGGTHTDLAVLTEAHGRAVSSLPIADLAIGSWLMATAEHPDAGSVAEGRVRVGIVQWPEATVKDGVLLLQGEGSPVVMPLDMDQFLILGEYADGEFAAAVWSDVRVLKTLDITRSWGRLDPGGPITEWTALPPGTVAYTRDALAVHRALDSAGAAARLLSMTVNYAGQREQFGVPIGSFQAVKHHCADMALQVEAAQSICWAAAAALDGDRKDARRTASAAAAYAKFAASRVAGLAQQVHGGIGFTWEHDLHLLLRRIKVNEAFDGTVAAHRAALLADSIS
jgi:Acyl-CoA dehydrogenase, C-terminal domain